MLLYLEIDAVFNLESVSLVVYGRGAASLCAHGFVASDHGLERRVQVRF